MKGGAAPKEKSEEKRKKAEGPGDEAGSKKVSEKEDRKKAVETTRSEGSRTLPKKKEEEERRKVRSRTPQRQRETDKKKRDKKDSRSRSVSGSRTRRKKREWSTLPELETAEEDQRQPGRAVESRGNHPASENPGHLAHQIIRRPGRLGSRLQLDETSFQVKGGEARCPTPIIHGGVKVQTKA